MSPYVTLRVCGRAKKRSADVRLLARSDAGLGALTRFNFVPDVGTGLNSAAAALLPETLSSCASSANVKKLASITFLGKASSTTGNDRTLIAELLVAATCTPVASFHLRCSTKLNERTRGV